MYKIRKLISKIIFRKECRHLYKYEFEGGTRRRKCTFCGQKQYFNDYYKRWKGTF